VAVEVRDLAVPPFKGQFVGDVGYAQCCSFSEFCIVSRGNEGLAG
jgi:hypothetical protein